MPPVTLDIVIVNWNAGWQLYRCLESISDTNKDNFMLQEIVVVDNASSDGVLDNLSDLGIPLTIIRNTENRGFAAACNQGAVVSNADYILFLNPDMQLLPNSLSVPISFMQLPENAEVGICGIQLLESKGKIARTCARFPRMNRFFVQILGLNRLLPGLFLINRMEEWEHTESRIVDQVMGAFFLVRRPVYVSLGGFDERFFVYYEEVDFSYRAHKAGWKSYYLADAQAFHKGCGTTESIKGNRLFYSLRSRVLYGFKHFDWLSALILTLGTLLIEPFTRLVYASVRGGRDEVYAVMQAYGLLLIKTLKLFNRKSK